MYDKNCDWRSYQKEITPQEVANMFGKDRTIPECELLPWDRRFHFYNSASIAWNDGDYVMTKEHGKVRFDGQRFIIEGE